MQDSLQRHPLLMVHVLAITATLGDDPQIHLQRRPPSWAPDSYFQESPTCSTWMSRNHFTLYKFQMELTFFLLNLNYVIFDLLSHLEPVLHRHVQIALLSPTLEGANSGACMYMCMCVVCVCICTHAICPPWGLFLHLFTVNSSWSAPHPFLFYGTLVSPSFWKRPYRDWSCVSAAPECLTDLGHFICWIYRFVSILHEWCKFRPYTHRWQGLRVLITHVWVFSPTVCGWLFFFFAASPKEFCFFKKKILLKYSWFKMC